MTVQYTADVFCDGCGNWIRGATGNKSSGLASKAIGIAKRNGWSRDVKSLYTDLCPACLIEFQRAPREAAAPGNANAGKGSPSHED